MKIELSLFYIKHNILSRWLDVAMCPSVCSVILWLKYVEMKIDYFWMQCSRLDVCVCVCGNLWPAGLH